MSPYKGEGVDWRVRKDKNPPRSLPQPHRDCHGTPCLATTQDNHCKEAIPHNPHCLCEPKLRGAKWRSSQRSNPGGWRAMGL